MSAALEHAVWFSAGGPGHAVTDVQRHAAVEAVLARIGSPGSVLLVPPDITRGNSRAGELTRLFVERLRETVPTVDIAILPAIGTHFPMTAAERTRMFGDLPDEMFKVHNWREGLVHRGEVPGRFLAEVSGGKVDYPVGVELDRLVADGGYDAIISIGQVVPHEVIGMANGNKNILVGTGGRDTINKTHFLGAVCNMETILGRTDNPVRAVLNYAEEQFLTDLPLVYVQTVIGRDLHGELDMFGLFVGTGHAPFEHAAELSRELNITMLDAPLKKVVVYLDPHEFKSTWLGNKSVYRTRMAMADDGELIVLAPGVETFGEDPEIDRLIRAYGYKGTPATLQAVDANAELRDNLSAAAHLVHGSSEGRFRITYAPGGLSQEEIERVGFAYGDLTELRERYNPDTLKDGMNDVAGEQVFYISNPALGLWALKEQFA
jgi:nickel-dependent lactate racemase